MKARLFILLCIVIIFTGCGAEKNRNDNLGITGGDKKFVDLTYAFDENSVYWVTAKEFKRETVAEGMTENGYFYSAYDYSAAEHGGTHIDAPFHFSEEGLTVERIPLDKLIAEGVLIDVSARSLKNPDYLVSVRDLSGFEAANGTIPRNSIVLLRTGYGKFYPDRAKYLGTKERGVDASRDLRFPGLDPNAAKWLVGERRIAAVGIDTASIDRGRSKLFQSHVELMTHDIPAFENVANLDRLPARGFTIIALPMKIKGGSGGPLRIVAIVDGNRK